MKRIITILAVLMLFCAVPALADEGGTYNVKYYATNLTEVYSQIAAAEFPEGGGTATRPPLYLTSNTTATVSCGDETRTVTINVVKPAFEVQAVPSISADSPHNQSMTALADYVYQYRVLKQTSPDYEAALGTAPAFELSRFSIGRDYDALGKTYTLTQTVMEQQVSQTVTVTPVTSRTPDVSIDEGGYVVCSPETVQYSIDGEAWSTIKNGSAIPNSCYGKRIYFRTPQSSYSSASESARVYVKEQQASPTTKLKLSSTSFSVTVDNVGDYTRDCEFSIDGVHYSSKTEWANLDANTSYKVYVRYRSDSSFFASAPLIGTISTKEGIKNEITYEKTSNANTTFFMATGTARLSLSNKTLTATYTNADVSTLKNDIKNASKHMSAVTVLGVVMEQEEGDTRDYNKIKLTMPKDMGLLQLRMTTPYCTLIVSDESTTLEIESIKRNATTSGLKEFVAGKDLIYRVTTNGDGKTQVMYPWEFPNRADLSGLRVDYTDSKFKNTTTLPYQVVDGGILFTLPDDGYFAITNLHRDYGSLPFADCQTHWAYSYIHYAYENGIVNGVSDTEFSPDTLVTRAQIAVLLARMAGAEEQSTYLHPYVDVPEGSWYSWAVGYLYQRGALKDQGDALFRPEESITREQMAALAAKVFPYSGTIWRPMNCNDRDQISTYALNAIDGLYNRNVFVGDADGNFKPTGTLTRGELVTILYRLATS